VVELSTVEVVNVEFITYLNRLSDFLFVLSRKIAHDLGAPEIAWKPRG
jgi:cob(I)alamin adenosyltransferase